jgi:hypothetical protein
LREVPKLRLAGLVILLILVFFLAPVVPYFQSVSIPGVSGGGVGLWGLSTPAYGVFGYGSPPYSQQEIVTQGNHSALVLFSGGRAVGVEDVGGPGVVLNPPAVVQIQNAVVFSSDWGFLNVTIRLQNVAQQDILNPIVYLSMQGFSTNSTLGGLTLIEPHVIGNCGAIFAASGVCSVSQIAPNTLPANKSFTFYAEVRGSVGGTPFVIREPFGENYPTGGVGPLWVKAFVNSVDNFRQGITMVENSTLDRFAAIRFVNASANFQISDYGFASDAQKFFGNGPLAGELAEVLLYPGVYTPASYASFLAGFAPGHWSELLDTVYTQFGYYVGRAPYYTVSVPCPVYEIPHGGINIAQYFESHGCSVAVTESTWLVIIMSP